MRLKAWSSPETDWWKAGCIGMHDSLKVPEVNLLGAWGLKARGVRAAAP